MFITIIIFVPNKLWLGILYVGYKLKRQISVTNIAISVIIVTFNILAGREVWKVHLKRTDGW